jgi:hypothetical protein
MKLSTAVGALMLLIGAADAAVRLEVPPNINGEVNVTSDSTRGWIPSVGQRQHAIKIVEMLLDALEDGRYIEAYGLLSDVIKRAQTLAQFTQNEQKFRTLAGPVKFWRVLKITWTKDSARAPFPGTYAAIDLAAQFANIDRDCGYIVVYQKTDGADFTILRRENNYLDNATARAIEQKNSSAEVVKAWEQLSRHCPNYAPAVDAR